jgi:hypothetical protein
MTLVDFELAQVQLTPAVPQEHAAYAVFSLKGLRTASYRQALAVVNDGLPGPMCRTDTSDVAPQLQPVDPQGRSSFVIALSVAVIAVIVLK